MTSIYKNCPDNIQVFMKEIMCSSDVIIYQCYDIEEAENSIMKMTSI